MIDSDDDRPQSTGVIFPLATVADSDDDDSDDWDECGRDAIDDEHEAGELIITTDFIRALTDVVGVVVVVVVVVAGARVVMAPPATDVSCSLGLCSLSAGGWLRRVVMDSDCRQAWSSVSRLLSFSSSSPLSSLGAATAGARTN